MSNPALILFKSLGVILAFFVGLFLSVTGAITVGLTVASVFGDTNTALFGAFCASLSVLGAAMQANQSLASFLSFHILTEEDVKFLENAGK